VREVGIARSSLDRLSLVAHRFFDENENDDGDGDGDKEEDENDNEKCGGGGADDSGGDSCGGSGSYGGGGNEQAADMGQRLLTRVALAEATWNELKVQDTNNATKDACQGKRENEKCCVEVFSKREMLCFLPSWF